MLLLDENDDPITLTNPLNINVATPNCILWTSQPYTNMCRMNTTNQAGGDLIFKVDDSAIQFKTGQTIRLSLKLYIGYRFSEKLKFYTDSLSRLKHRILWNFEWQT